MLFRSNASPAISARGSVFLRSQSERCIDSIIEGKHSERKHGLYGTQSGKPQGKPQHVQRANPKSMLVAALQAQMHLPASQRDMLQTEQLQIIERDPVRPANPPFLVFLRIHDTRVHILDIAVVTRTWRRSASYRRTAMKSCTVRATFLASLARVMGSGRDLKSRVGI